MCNQSIYDQYVFGDKSTSNGHLAVFVANWVFLSMIFDGAVCCIFVGVLMLIPSSAIMCSIFINRKYCSAIQPCSSLKSTSGHHVASEILSVESVSTF